MSAEHPTHPNAAHPALNRFLLPNQEYVTCVLWNGLYHITGTDIVRCPRVPIRSFWSACQEHEKV